MANPLYSLMQNNPLMSNLKALQNNPVQFLMQRKFNIPQNIANDPNAIIQHLMNTGQVSQDVYNRAIKTAEQFRNKG